MGIGIRTGGLLKGAALVLVGVAGSGAALAVASVPGSDGVIHACVTMATTNGVTAPSTTGANVRIIDTGAGQSCSNPAGVPQTLSELDWNQTGPTGPTGSTGPQGPPGTPGAPGKSVTVAGGHTLTLGGGQVITIGNLPVNTINIPPPPTRPSGNTVALNIAGMTVPVNGFSFVNGSGKQTGAGAGKVSFHEFQITKQVDKSSPKLAQFCVTGKHFPTVTITVRKAGGKAQAYLTYTLTDVLISSYQTGGSGHDVTPTESLSLNFTKLQIAYVK